MQAHDARNILGVAVWDSTTLPVNVEIFYKGGFIQNGATKDRGFISTVLGNTNVREPLLRTVISGFTRVPWCISAVGDRQDREMFVSLLSETDEAISIANDRTDDIRYVIEWCD